MVSVTVRMLALVGVVGLAAPALAQTPAQVPDAATKAKVAGDQYAQAGNLQAARKAYEKALRIDPTYALAHNQLGTTFFKLGRPARAIEEFQAAVRSDPRYGTAWFNLAYAARKAKRWPVAVDAYRKYTALKPDDADGWYGLAQSLEASGDKAGAAKAYDAYASHATRPDQQQWAAKARAKAKALRQEVAQAAQARQQAAAQAQAQQAAAQAQAQQAAAQAQARQQAAAQAQARQQAAAQAQAQQATAQAKQQAQSDVAKGDQKMKAKDYPGAAAAYAAAVRLAPRDVEAHYKLGYAYALAGHLEKAVPEWQAVLRLDPGNAGAKKNIAVAQARLAAERQKAAPATGAPSAQGRAAARKAYETGVRLINARKYGDAVGALTQAVKDDPTLAVAWIARGSAYVGIRRYHAAIQDYEKGHQLAPGMASPLFGLGEAHRALGENAEAAKYYSQYASSHARDADAHLQDLARKWAARLR